jgi:hypothetical protein
MTNKRAIVRACRKFSLVVMTMIMLVTTNTPLAFMQSGGVPTNKLNRNEPPFDFSDEFYLANGINPSNLPNRLGEPTRNPAHWTVDDSVTDPTRRGIRVLETTGGWDRDGNLIYYSIMSDVLPRNFTNDAAGVRARMLAENFRAFLFPKTPRKPDGSPNDDRNDPNRLKLSPAPPNRRQDNVFDTKDAYFCENLLGLWIVTFVIYTQKAWNALFRNTDPEAKKILDEIIAKNGRDLDGTPLLNTVEDIERLERLGLVELRFNKEVGPPGGEDGPRWVL